MHGCNRNAWGRNLEDANAVCRCDGVSNNGSVCRVLAAAIDAAVMYSRQRCSDVRCCLARGIDVRAAPLVPHSRSDARCFLARGSDARCFLTRGSDARCKGQGQHRPGRCTLQGQQSEPAWTVAPCNGLDRCTM